jgi:NADP-dependent 3-hydroxy acid dehydrogenase YdfG
MKKGLFILSLLFIIVVAYVGLNNLDKQPINQSTKTCLITGASSGLGYELSLEMIKHGWKVIGIARREEKLKEIAQKIGPQFIPHKCDVSMPVQIHEVSNAIRLATNTFLFKCRNR